MTLILEITSPPPVGGVVGRQAFHEEGGSIGRETGSSWVLPHSKVSGLHAVISYRNGVYYIEDRSRNGVCLNSARNRLERGRPYALTSGDSILIDPYAIRVSIASAETHDERPRSGADNRGEGQRRNRPAELEDPFGFADPNDPFAPLPINSSGSGALAEDIPRQALDPMELLNLTPSNRPPARKLPSGQDLQRGSLLDEVVKVPRAIPDPARPPVNPSTIPEDYDPLAPDDVFPPLAPPPEKLPEPPAPRAIASRPREDRRPAVPVQPPPAASPLPPLAASPLPPLAASPAPAPAVMPGPRPIPGAEVEAELESEPEPKTGAPGAAVDFAAVLRGAGLDPAEVTPEVAQEFGQILRVVVAGVMDVMRSRQQIKDEFRMQVTRVRPIENNPLKFSADVDDALHNLLLKRNRAYLQPVEAFEDAFADLRHHQIAMLSGMRVAFEAMLAEFDPDRLQQEFDRQMNKGLVPAKLRYWDLYREKRREIVKDPETSFRRLFGETFARAYEEQLRELKAQERGAGGASPKNRKPSE